MPASQRKIRKTHIALGTWAKEKINSKMKKVALWVAIGFRSRAMMNDSDAQEGLGEVGIQ